MYKFNDEVMKHYSKVVQHYLALLNSEGTPVDAEAGAAVADAVAGAAEGDFSHLLTEEELTASLKVLLEWEMKRKSGTIKAICDYRKTIKRFHDAIEEAKAIPAGRGSDALTKALKALETKNKKFRVCLEKGLYCHAFEVLLMRVEIWKTIQKKKLTQEIAIQMKANFEAWYAKYQKDSIEISEHNQWQIKNIQEIFNDLLPGGTLVDGKKQRSICKDIFSVDRFNQPQAIQDDAAVEFLQYHGIECPSIEGPPVVLRGATAPWMTAPAVRVKGVSKSAKKEGPKSAEKKGTSIKETLEIAKHRGAMGPQQIIMALFTGSAQPLSAACVKDAKYSKEALAIMQRMFTFATDGKIDFIEWARGVIRHSLEEIPGGLDPQRVEFEVVNAIFPEYTE